MKLWVQDRVNVYVTYKTKGHFGKNTTLTPTKTLPKKYDYSPIIF